MMKKWHLIGMIKRIVYMKRWDRPCFTQTKYFAFSAHLMVPFTYRLKVLTFERSQKYFGFLLTKSYL